MRKFLISALLVGATVAAVPASAQYNRGHRSDNGIDRQIQEIENRIRQAAQQRRISRNEANRLLSRAEQIDRLEDRYSRNGLTTRELQDLRNRVQNLRQQLRWDRQDGRRDRRW